MSKQPIFIQHSVLKPFIQQIFSKVGLANSDAEIMASHLISASLRGIESHGVSRVPLYTERMMNGHIKIGSDFILEAESPTHVLVDGKDNHGILIAQQAVEMAVEKAKSQGMAIVGVKNSNHFGMLAFYAEYVASRDCIGVITSNASPSMPPWGGGEPYFGTNPICYALPAGKEQPIIGDMATSIAARGKIRLAAKNNEEIPEGWALTKEGKNTTNPAEALEGMVLPLGGPKGYSLVVLFEALSAILTGAAFGQQVGAIVDPKPQGLGHFFLVIRPDIFQPLEEYKARIDQMIQEIKAVKKMDGVSRIYLPGEIEREKEQTRKIEGIPLSNEVYKDLVSTGEKFNVSPLMI